MREHGYTLMELLVAAAIGVIITLGLASFFLAMVRFGKDVDAQAALQRQGTAIAEELGRRLRLADGSPKIENPASPPALPACLSTTDPLPTNDLVLVIPNPDGSVTCMYRDTGSPPQLVRCNRPTPDGVCTPVANLLNGSLAPLFATAWSASLVTPCDASDLTCSGVPAVCSDPTQSCSAVPGAAITFTLSDGINRPETFGVTTVTSRH